VEHDRKYLDLWLGGNGVPKQLVSDSVDLPKEANFSTYDGFDSFQWIRLHPSGDISFTATLFGSFLPFQSIWSGQPGRLKLVAYEGMAAPGTSAGTSFEYIEQEEFSATGYVAFHGYLTGESLDSTSRYGLWSTGSGSLELIASLGDAAPGASSGAVFTDFWDVAIGPTGESAIRAYFSGRGFHREGIWVQRDGALAPVAIGGSTAPGTGTIYTHFSGKPSLSPLGKVAFIGWTIQVDQNTNGSGIWSDRSGVLSMVAQHGRQAPDMPNGVVFQSLGAPHLNSAGEIVFTAQIKGTGITTANNFGIWSDEFGNQALVTRTGNQAPGTSIGVNFQGFSAVTLNSAGQIAFSASLSGTSIDGTNDQGIWAESRTGELQLVVRKGNLLNIAPRDARVVDWFEFKPEAAFNDRGQLVFAARFTDGTHGVFLSNIVAVPEPLLLHVIPSAVILFICIRRQYRATN
jgi:hypothetical protein